MCGNSRRISFYLERLKINIRLKNLTYNQQYLSVYQRSRELLTHITTNLYDITVVNSSTKDQESTGSIFNVT